MVSACAKLCRGDGVPSLVRASLAAASRPQSLPRSRERSRLHVPGAAQPLQTCAHWDGPLRHPAAHLVPPPSLSAGTTSVELWASPVPPPTALRSDAADMSSPRAVQWAEGETGLDGTRPLAAGEEDASGSPSASEASKRERSTPSGLAAAVKRARWGSPLAASTSGLGESQQSLPSPAVADSPMVDKVQSGAESAVCALTYSPIICPGVMGT